MLWLLVEYRLDLMIVVNEMIKFEGFASRKSRAAPPTAAIRCIFTRFLALLCQTRRFIARAANASFQEGMATTVVHQWCTLTHGAAPF